MRLSAYSWLRWGSGGYKERCAALKKLNKKMLRDEKNCSYKRPREWRHVIERNTTPDTDGRMFIFRAADWIACLLFAEMSFTCYFKTEESTNQTEQTASSSDRGEKAKERAQRMFFFFFHYSPAQLQRRHGLLISWLCVSRLCAALNRNK